MDEKISTEDTATDLTPANPLHPPNQADGDAELTVINQVVKALNLLTEEQRQRVMEYVLRRFNVAPRQTSLPGTLGQAGSANPTLQGREETQLHMPTSGAIRDIRTLKEAKLPKSANEMAALVSYYVSELAPENDRKKTIEKADIERYFKTAGFRLPADAAFTLVNAKNAGYLDSAGAGQYTLNPVGYNLVVHRMGNRDDNSKKTGNGGKRRPKTRPQQSKKALRAKK